MSPVTDVQVQLLGCAVPELVGASGVFADSTLSPASHRRVRVDDTGRLWVVGVGSGGHLVDAAAWVALDERSPARIAIEAGAGSIARCRWIDTPTPSAAADPATVAVTAVGADGPVRSFEARGCLGTATASGGVAELPIRSDLPCEVAAFDGLGHQSQALRPGDVAAAPLYLGPPLLAALHVPVQRVGREWVTVRDVAPMFSEGVVVSSVDGIRIRGRRGAECLAATLAGPAPHDVVGGGRAVTILQSPKLLTDARVSRTSPRPCGRRSPRGIRSAETSARAESWTGPWISPTGETDSVYEVLTVRDLDSRSSGSMVAPSVGSTDPVAQCQIIG